MKPQLEVWKLEILFCWAGEQEVEEEEEEEEEEEAGEGKLFNIHVVYAYLVAHSHI